VKVQEQREESEKKLEHFRAEEVHFMNSMAQSIADANEQQKAMHDKVILYSSAWKCFAHARFLSSTHEMLKHRLWLILVSKFLNSAGNLRNTN